MFKPVFFDEVKTYSLAKFKADLFAGVTVGIVALPLAMAFAIACGISPERGIYTAIVAGFLISTFSGSRLQIGGPTGAFIVIIASIYLKYGDSGLMASTLLAGALLIVMGFFKMGNLIKYIPFPVVVGFTSGIAVVILSTQINDILGLKLTDAPGEFLLKMQYYFEHLDRFNPWALVVSLLTVAVIMTCKQSAPKLPALLIGMLVSSLVAIVLKLPVETIGDRFGELPRSLPVPKLLFPSFHDLGQLIMPACTIALLAGIESLLSATVADSMTGDRHRPNTELTAQGIGNIGSVIFGGIPATGAIARTATNIKSGAQTPVAGMIHAVVLLLVLALFAPQAKSIPLASLSGIMIVICYNMSEYRTFIRMFYAPKSDWAVMLVTFLVTVIFDLVLAVQLGVMLAAFLFLRRMAEEGRIAPLSQDDSPENTRHEIPPQVAIFDFSGPLFFGVIDKFKNVLDVSRINKKVIILQMDNVTAIDVAGLEQLSDLLKKCKKNNIKLILSGLDKRSQVNVAIRKYQLKVGTCRRLESALKLAKGKI